MQTMVVSTDAQRQIRMSELQAMNERDMVREEESKKNRDFVQIYRASMPEIRWLMVNHAFASSVLFFILEHMDGRNCLSCTHEIIMDYFGKSRSTVHRAIKILEENGFLGILKQGPTNVYIINAQVAWTSYQNQKTGLMLTYASIDGKMLVSRKENVDYSIEAQAERFKALGAKVDKKQK